LIEIKLPHFADTATIELISGLNQRPDDESWGFREVHVRTLQAIEDIVVVDDLEEVDFTEHDKAWEVTDAVADAVTSSCGGKALLGGYNTFGGATHLSRQWNDLPEHDYIVVYFKAYFIDAWDKEAFVVKVDDVYQK
jgi:hypothetical protein